MSDNIRDYLKVSVFARDLESGNPAAVCGVSEWPDDRELESIARKIAMPVTSFVRDNNGALELRWYTRSGNPVGSMCGHGTLAAAKFVSERNPSLRQFVFKTSAYDVPVERDDDVFTVTLPRWEVRPIEPPAGLGKALGSKPVEVLDGGRDLIAIYSDEDTVRALRPDMEALKAFGRRGVIATAQGRVHDCVSRFFCPTFGLGTDEDPVTGSAYCSIAPFWSRRLGKSRLSAFQASDRGGELFCEILDDGVRISAPVAVQGWAKMQMG
jgi:PhzF family phenazine biosynthesis protein